jgi:hypothetical protein
MRAPAEYLDETAASVRREAQRVPAEAVTRPRSYEVIEWKSLRRC